MKVFVLSRPIDRAKVGDLVAALQAAGFDATFGAEDSSGDIVDQASLEIEQTDRVLIVWNSEIRARGTIFQLGVKAARLGKLTILLLDDADASLDSRVPRVRAGDDDAIEQLSLALSRDGVALDIPEETDGETSRELFQSDPVREDPSASVDDEDDVFFAEDDEADTGDYARYLELRRSLDEYKFGGIMRAAREPIPRKAWFGRPDSDDLGNRGRIPADAKAFAPARLRAGTPELVQLIVFRQGQDRVITSLAKASDGRAKQAQRLSLGSLVEGSEIGVAIDVRGANVDTQFISQRWNGEPLAFAFMVEANLDARQVVCRLRLYSGEAQVGHMAFARSVSGREAESHVGKPIPLKRHKYVFISYSSEDRETVSKIATAYRVAGVPHFWDRTSLESGEEWSPRLRREIERSDLFHLCWSKAAARSNWVEKEAAHAIERRNRARRPNITVQMLDGPPWAPHPTSLDSINFDDFARAAVVGYARGDSSDRE